MKLSSRTLKQLRELINEEPDYRTGPDIVDFFNKLGFELQYTSSFPSRWVYTDQLLEEINGTVKIENCIKNLFNPINFIGRNDILNEYVNKFNEYLYFDDFKITLSRKMINIIPLDESDEIDHTEVPIFLEQTFPDIDMEKLNIDTNLKMLLKQRLDEINSLLESNATLSIIFMCGSILEGLLTSFGNNFQKEYYTAKSPSKDMDGKPKPISDWSLSDLIDISYKVGVIRHDVKQHSHVLRDFRNYIHPIHQQKVNFTTDIHTVRISLQVLNAAFAQAIEYQNSYIYSEKEKN